MNSFQWKIQTRIGPLYLVASENGLQSAFWQPSEVPSLPSLASNHPAAKVLAMAAEQLNEYFQGKRIQFDIPLDVPGTPFQKAVWQELLRIPYGKTLSYSEVARRIGRDKAVRAVGTANGRNPISIIVPCHRVISSDGSLGGYSGGLDIKAKLLDLERSSKKAF